ncbi:MULTISPECIES: septal ring lytic transglycosylase RlpA family protein [unclassified Pedobacter]|uniref:septal ring lytic transglycosylase RlpA family protein n=1 Tax=Pedobacter TaxID=84567 RepID=UPI002247C272|nr:MULTISPECIES: septal ring lytic transglycosylase RlpA family protein [unclassified Pedobacter]MCX2432516.1 septal ring lytic transglycosylase RlpA family protein [Pedobacter sp. GR22-10]MCX2583396.1 septal ring lytic transglycosylase RlpA family protein [Pedobacter sp. MR22-3]
MKYLLLLSFSLLFLQGKAQNSGPLNAPDSINKTVLATYYHRKFEGRRTTSGVKYRAKKLTAAHRTLPMGTMITVTNPDNGKSVVVKVNDRGPFSKKLAIDLSESAAKQIGIYRQGIAKVSLSYNLE